MEEDISECRNCKRRVASAHLALHEAHCLRFLALCPGCKEPIRKEKMEEHQEREHQQANECRERPVKCKFCELAVRFSKLGVHEGNCGCRTERCTNCDQYFMLRELTHHKDVCQGRQAELGRGKKISVPARKIHFHSCNQRIPGNKDFHHVHEYCQKISETEISPPTLPFQPADDQTSKTEKVVRPKTKYTNRFPLLSENSTKQEPRVKSKALRLPRRPELTSWSTFPQGDEAAYDVLRRCSQCGILLPLPTLNRHQEKCWRLASSRGKQVRNSS
ncbi:XIAP-associated factor 1 isoform X2 [Dasypus novemcinctus]|uniref:XIAP-associated factor 1 isoform X2 n=1 Tax=Dasypus novemcinctus TaxID=9361 RepID=UPI00265F7ACE|nr:XIAP-associated factor 1 isoform X2 [Dasypus novemcinctus]